MKLLKFAFLALRYNCSAQMANPVNLFMGFLGMAINNVFFMLGLYAVLFGGKPQNANIYPYFLAASTLSFFAWGFVHFFLGGLSKLPEQIDNGTFEEFLGMPRSPIALAALSDFNPPSLADFIQGIICIGLGGYLFGFNFGLKLFCASIIASIAVLGLYIFCGSVSFFVRRGAAIATVIMHSTLSFSIYPTGIIFSGSAKLLFYFTPVLFTTLLPIDAIMSGNWHSFLFALAMALLFLFFSVQLFNFGTKRYESSSFVSLKGS